MITTHTRSAYTVIFAHCNHTEGSLSRRRVLSCAWPVAEPAPAGVWLQLARCWSLPANTANLLTVSTQRSGEMAALNGMRCLSTALIVLIHTFMNVSTMLSNDPDVASTSGVVSLPSFQVVYTGQRRACVVRCCWWAWPVGARLVGKPRVAEGGICDHDSVYDDPSL